MKDVLKLPIIDLSSPDRWSTANTIRQACIKYGFFYVMNHGVEEEAIGKVFEESNKFFSLPLEEKMKLILKEHRGYIPLFGDIVDPFSAPQGDCKESYYIGPLEDISSSTKLNQWPSQGKTMKVYRAGELQWNPIIAKFYGFGDSGEETYGTSPHSDYGMATLLVSDGVRGLQVCREKSKQPRVWEDVLHINGEFIVNIGDMIERWTNCLFRSTLHRVMLSGQERYSVAFFLDPNEDCVVQCIESCCSESSPPRFPLIRSGDYLNERLSAVIRPLQ